MSKFFCRTLFLLVLAGAPLSAVASNFLYLIDTSGSMRSNRIRAALSETVLQDVKRAFDNRSYAEGDRIEVWTFNLEVSVLLRTKYKLGAETKLRAELESELKRLKMRGPTNTSIAKPLIKAFEEFGAADTGDLSVFLYTDGRDSISLAEAEKVRRLYNHQFKPSKRLTNFFVIHFGASELPKATQTLLADIEAKTVAAGITPDVASRSAPVPEPVPPQTSPTIISVEPKSIRLSAGVAPEIVQAIPIEFAVSPARSGLLVKLGLNTNALPQGMVMTTIADLLAAEGRQSVVFMIRNAAPGRYTAGLKLFASVDIQPSEIPVEIEILSAKPGQIGLQFFPEKPSLIELPADDQWHNAPNVGLSLFYPEALNQTLVRFEAELPPGIEIRMRSSKEPGSVVGFGGAAKLSYLGRALGLQIRRASSDVTGKELTATLRVDPEPGQNVSHAGTNSITIPFRFSSPTEVQVETSEVILGEISPGTRNLKRILNIRVKGQSEGKRIRLLKQGTGLEGLTILPSEIALKPDFDSVELEFGGLEGRAPGNFGGTIALIPSNETFKVSPSTVLIKGRVLEPSKIVAHLENPMVAGQPLVIHARFDSSEKGSMNAIIHPPGLGKSSTITLVDNGSADDGDSKPDDGLYAGVFKENGALGRYQITVNGKGTNNVVQSASLSAPIYFKSPSSAFTGMTARRKENELIRFKPTITSDFNGRIAIQEETATAKHGLPTFLSNQPANKLLERGDNAVELSVELTRETRPGQYKYQVYLVTDPIEGNRAKIPVSFEITVLSFLQYLLRLLAIAVTLAFAAFLAVVVPWRKLGWLRSRNNASSRRRRPRPGMA